MCIGSWEAVRDWAEEAVRAQNLESIAYQADEYGLYLEDSEELLKNAQ